MANTDEKLTRAEAQRLHRKARDLERDADDFRTAGLDDRAAKLEADAEQLRERVEASKKAHQQQEREQRRRDREAERRHKASRKKMKAEMARQEAARTWYRSWLRFSNGRPQPAEQILETAEQAGHDREDLEAAVVRVKRRKDGVECLGFKGEYLRGEFLPVEQRTASVGR